MEKSKTEKVLGRRKWKKKQAKEERNSSICKGKKKNLAKSNKGSWFGQIPSTICASAEDPEHSNIPGASSLKNKVNLSAGCKQDFLSGSGGSNEEKEECYTNGPKHWSIDSLTSCFSAAHFPTLTFLARVLPLPSLPFILRRCPELNFTERDKNTCCNAMLFPGNLDLLS